MPCRNWRAHSHVMEVSDSIKKGRGKMDTNTLTMWVVVANSVAWMVFAALVLFEMNRMTLRLQVVEPPRPRRRKIKRLTGILGDDLWNTIESWHADGWEIVLCEEHGVRIHTIILQKFV